MGRGVKVAAWAALFLGCAGVGAFVAAHSDPFPPAVDRPSGSATVSVPPSSATPAAPDRWSGSLRSFTYHELYVGGRCSTQWRGSLRFTVDGAGRIEGSGVARLAGKLECDFPIAQVQAERIRLAVSGRLGTGALVMHLARVAVEPSGSQDFGGFVGVTPIRVVFRLRDDKVSGRYVRERIDEEGRGTFHWSTEFRLARVDG